MTYLGFSQWDQVEEWPDMAPLIEGVIDKDSLIVLAGPYGSMKTFIALSWACSVATGVPWFNHKAARGRVLYLAAEGYRKFPARVRAWSKHNEATVPGRNLLVRSGVFRMTPDVLRAPTSPFGDWPKFIGFVSESQPALLVVDTLAMAIAGEPENDFATMSAATGLARRITETAPGCSVLLIHHFGKDASRGPSGHQSLPNQSDIVYHAQLGSKTACLTEGGYVNLTCDKKRDDERAEPVRLCLKPVDDSVVPVEYTAAS